MRNLSSKGRAAGLETRERRESVHEPDASKGRSIKLGAWPSRLLLSDGQPVWHGGRSTVHLGLRSLLRRPSSWLRVDPRQHHRRPASIPTAASQTPLWTAGPTASITPSRSFHHPTHASIHPSHIHHHTPAPLFFCCFCLCPPASFWKEKACPSPASTDSHVDAVNSSAREAPRQSRMPGIKNASSPSP